MNQQTVSVNLSIAGKSMIIAYLLWWFLGTLGVHRFYLGKTGSGLTQLLLFVTGVGLAIFAIGYAFLLVWFVWWALDAFFLYRIVNKINADLGLASSTVSMSRSGSVTNELDQLDKLHALFEKGVISEEQYELKKAAII